PLRQRIADASYLVVIAMAAALIGFAALAFARAGMTGHAAELSSADEHMDHAAMGMMVPLSAAELAGARAVGVTAANLRFDPPTITARPGEAVRVQLRNADTLLHDWSAPQ